MLFMVIEHWDDADKVMPIYQRSKDESTRPPDGITILHSWAEANWERLFNVIECDDLLALQEWVLNWAGYEVSWEIVPIVHSADTLKLVGPHLKP